ncbi:MAG: hypothetical protein M1816_001020 [Peltula sp. TS41687]|nr:MAG: hypothetical protein M1816_001020 [Peltula sp. TS41687]
MAPLDKQRGWNLALDSSVSPKTLAFDLEVTIGHGGRGPVELAAVEGFHYPPDSYDGQTDDPTVGIVAERSKPTVKEVTNHASTPPIPVPSTFNHGVDLHEPRYLQPPEQRWHQPSPFEEASKQRRTSISFHPKVMLDTGHEKELDEPLPKPSRWFPGSRPRGRSMLTELSNYHQPPKFLSRPQRDFEKSKDGPLIGSLNHGKSGEADDGSRSLAGGERFPLLQTTVDELAHDAYLARERMASLTSATSSTPPLDDVHTPPESPRILNASPLLASSPARHPTSAEEHGAWQMQAHSLDYKRRTRSDIFDRANKLRAGRRSASVRSSKSMSPASAFLSTWGKAAAAADPDDEGQEVGDYVLGKQVGFGSSSVVREAFGFENGQRVRRAVKIVRKHVNGKTNRENEQLQAEFEHEVSMWRCLSHRFILPLLVVYDTPFATFCFTELHTGGSLFDLVRANRNGLPVHQVKRYAAQLASALRYLHEDVRVVHRDVKLENCLVDLSSPGATEHGGNVLLCDFGMAEYIPHGGNEDQSADSPNPYDRVSDGSLLAKINLPKSNSSVVGSLEYSSPESLLSRTELFSTAADIWAFGVVAYALIVGDLPFRHTFLPRVQMMILKGDWDETAIRCASGIGDWGDDAVEFVRGCLDMDPNMRMTVGQVLNSSLLLEEAREMQETRLDRVWML